MNRHIYDNLPKYKLCKIPDNINVFYRYDYINGLWTNSIAIHDKKIIQDSNHFMLFFQEIQESGIVEISRKPHYIYTRIRDNYNKIINNKNDIITIDERCVILSNSFLMANAGHDIAYILDTIHKFIDKQDIKFVIFDEIPKNSFNMQLINLYIPSSRLLVINENNVYNFKNYIPNTELASYDISSYKNLINNINTKLINTIENTYSKDTIESMKNKTVIIIKTDKMIYVTRPDDQFISTELYKYSDINKNICILNPETDNYYEFIYKLLNAKTIFTAHHGISCANQIYYNLKANIYSLLPHNNSQVIINECRNINYDRLNNSYYHNLIRKTIYMPLNISSSNIKQLEYLF